MTVQVFSDRQSHNPFYSILTFHNTVYPEWYEGGEEEVECLKYFGVLTLHGEVDSSLLIQMSHGDIYDWHNRQWVQTLELGNTTDKFYYIQSETPQEVKGFIFIKQHMEVVDEISLLPDLVDELGEIELIDHTVHMMQQRVRDHDPHPL